MITVSGTSIGLLCVVAGVWDSYVSYCCVMVGVWDFCVSYSGVVVGVWDTYIVTVV